MAGLKGSRERGQEERFCSCRRLPASFLASVFPALCFESCLENTMVLSSSWASQSGVRSSESVLQSGGGRVTSPLLSFHKPLINSEPGAFPGACADTEVRTTGFLGARFCVRSVTQRLSDSSSHQPLVSTTRRAFSRCLQGGSQQRLNSQLSCHLTGSLPVSL